MTKPGREGFYSAAATYPIQSWWWRVGKYFTWMRRWRVEKSSTQPRWYLYVGHDEVGLESPLFGRNEVEVPSWPQWNESFDSAATTSPIQSRQSRAERTLTQTWTTLWLGRDEVEVPIRLWRSQSWAPSTQRWQLLRLDHGEGESKVPMMSPIRLWQGRVGESLIRQRPRWCSSDKDKLENIWFGHNNLKRRIPYRSDLETGIPFLFHLD